MCSVALSHQRHVFFGLCLYPHPLYRVAFRLRLLVPIFSSIPTPFLALFPPIVSTLSSCVAFAAVSPIIGSLSQSQVRCQPYRPCALVPVRSSTPVSSPHALATSLPPSSTRIISVPRYLGRRHSPRTSPTHTRRNPSREFISLHYRNSQRVHGSSASDGGGPPRRLRDSEVCAVRRRYCISQSPYCSHWLQRTLFRTCLEIDGA